MAKPLKFQIMERATELIHDERQWCRGYLAVDAFEVSAEQQGERAWLDQLAADANRSIINCSVRNLCNTTMSSELVRCPHGDCPLIDIDRFGEGWLHSVASMDVAGQCRKCFDVPATG